MACNRPGVVTPNVHKESTFSGTVKFVKSNFDIICPLLFEAMETRWVDAFSWKDRRFVHHVTVTKSLPVVDFFPVFYIAYFVLTNFTLPPRDGV